MPPWLGHFIVSIFLLSITVAGHPESCAGACELALGDVVFPDVRPGLGYYPTRCGSRLRITSVFSCMRVYCRSDEIGPGWNGLNGDCELYGNTTLPPFGVVDDISDDEIARFRRLSLDESKNGVGSDRPLLPDRALFDIAFRTKDAWNNSVVLRRVYGNHMFFFWIFAVAVGLGNRFLLSRRNTKSAVVYSEKEGSGSAIRIRTRSENLLRRWFIIPATFSHRCSEPVGWCTIPPRLQTAVLSLFVAMNIVLCCINYEVFEGNLYWNKKAQWARYIGDRTGVISAANLPLIWLFATRNNVILYFTGWSFDTAMQFHRWVARVSTIEAVVHSVAYTVVAFEHGSWKGYLKDWSHRYWYMGTLATVVMSLLCVFSVYPIRQYHYEIFLITHISLGILTILGMWYHFEIFNGDYYGYIWPCIVIWLVDRVARVCRLAYHNFPIRSSSLRYDLKSNVVWLTVPSTSNKKPKPGEYYFLYLLHGRAFYESHPFTMSSWSRSSADLHDQEKLHLNFLIRPYDGFTRRLAMIAQDVSDTHRSFSAPVKVHILAEGPYGPSHNLKHLDSLVFVVGGSGVAVALAYLTDMCEVVRNGGTPYHAQHFRIIWAVQYLAFFDQVYEQEIRLRLDELSSALKTLQVELDVYVTKGATACHVPIQISGSKVERIHQVEDNHADEDPSDKSPLLSPPSPASPVRVSSSSSSSSSSTLDATSVTSNPSTSIPLSDSKANYAIPPNTTLNMYTSTRPDISLLISEASQWRPSLDSHLQPMNTEPIDNDNDDGANDLTRIVTGPKHFDSSRAPRIGILCCGPASLADATRAAVVKVLGDRRSGDVEFWNESYTW